MHHQKMINAHQLCISLLNSCKSINHLKQIHAFVSKTGLKSDDIIIGKMILHSSVTLANSLDYAYNLFLQITFPDAFTYNTLIRGFSESDCNPIQPILLFNQMRRRLLLPDSFTFAFLLKASAKIKAFHFGAQVHSLSIHHGLDTHIFVATTLVSMYSDCEHVSFARKAFEGIQEPNVVSWNAIITACFKSNDVKAAEGFFARMPVKDVTSWNLMLAGYIKAGNLKSAEKLFFTMQEKDSVSWSTMITGFCTNGHFEDACILLRDLLREGLRPSEVSLTSILSACAQSGALENGKILHAYVMNSGCISMIAVSNALLDMYSRCGTIEMAHCVFVNEMANKNTVSWTSMMLAFAMYGYGEKAVKLFYEMVKIGLKPDEVTFTSVLYACSHSGLVDQGSKLFEGMEGVFGISPTVEHYGCMVDLYGRCGLLEEAYGVISEMPIEPNAIIWRTLLGACCMHGNVKLAELAKKCLIEIDPEHSGDYVLMSNLYASAGKWRDADEVRRTMSKEKMKKSPGWSSIEIERVVYRFVANDVYSVVGVEADEKLKEIMEKLKDEGYVPETGNVLQDIEEEEKQVAVVRHSEKLAVAFGMGRNLNVESGIRVVKNLRMCSDCHVVMKMISKVYGREIVVRDRSRFHFFRNGCCSCGEYW